VKRPRAGKIALVFTLLSAILVLGGCGTVDPRASGAGAAAAKPGGRILFAQNGDIYLWNGGVQQVTHLGDASSPTWASDGKRFVFVRTGDAVSDLYAGMIDGDQYQQLTFDKPNVQVGSKDYVDNAVWALQPSWSPVADTIAYVSDLATDKNFLWIIRGLGNRPTQIPASTVNGDNVEDPHFSPDGNQIVFTQRVTDPNTGDRRTGLWIVDLNTGQLIPLVNSDSTSYSPAWSPDGKWIAFIQRDGKNNDLWVVPAAGGQATKLTDGRSLASPSWAPDNSAIAFFEVDGSSFHVSYIGFALGAAGTPLPGTPDKLFSAGNMDTTSGLSWSR
jgi:TolB protein